MSGTTGPILAAGAITWSNQVLLSDETPDVFVTTTRLGVATGILAALFYGLERFVGDFAIGLAWTALVTTLVVRFNNKPTPLERVLDLVA